MTVSTETPRRSFADFFADEIAPHIEALETQRQNRLRQTYARLGGTVFLGAIAAVIAWLSWHPVAGIAVVVLGIVIGALWEIGRAHV